MLETAHRAVESLLKTNYFGEGCVEGAALREALFAAVGANGSWRNELVSQITSLIHLAEQCEQAAEELSTTDQETGEAFRVDE